MGRKYFLNLKVCFNLNIIVLFSPFPYHMFQMRLQCCVHTTNESDKNQSGLFHLSNCKVKLMIFLLCLVEDKDKLSPSQAQHSKPKSRA